MVCICGPACAGAVGQHVCQRYYGAFHFACTCNCSRLIPALSDFACLRMQLYTFLATGGATPFWATNTGGPAGTFALQSGKGMLLPINSCACMANFKAC